MSQRGEMFRESPQACPFVALELDRDRRSDKPDYRHRCFAEPTPQPRAIAHQEAYCLSAEFGSCPIFQGWAMRAAARPVPVPAGYQGHAALSQPQSPMPTVAEAQASAAQSLLPVDVPPVVPAPGETWPAAAFNPAPAVETPSQLAAFEPVDSGGQGAGRDDFEPPPPAWSTAIPAGSGFAADMSDETPYAPAEGFDDAPVPGFLAGRSERPPSARPRASRPDVQSREIVSREDLVPSWELTGRYGADPSDGHGGRHRRGEDGGGDAGGGGRFGGLATAIAVVAILALGVAGVIFLPGLLAGRPAATPTPAITLAPTFLASPSLPVATVTPVATIGPSLLPTVTPELEATPRLYRIKSGDTLGRIAQRFDVSVPDILAANPQITDADHIEPGQFITIPPAQP